MNWNPSRANQTALQTQFPVTSFWKLKGLCLLLNCNNNFNRNENCQNLIIKLEISLLNDTVTKFSSNTFSLLCFSSHFSLIWFAPSIFAPSHKTKSADILFCKDTNLIKFEPKSLFPDCPISVSFMCGHARFSPQGSPASLLPRLLPPRGLQSWALESHHFYTVKDTVIH